MVTQIRPIRKEGTTRWLTFYEPNNLSDSQQSASNADISKRTKEIIQEFTGASNGAMLIRKAFEPIMSEIKDLYSDRRLVHEMGAIIKTDTTNPHGLRQVADGDIELLHGFNVNTDLALAKVLKAPFEASIDRATGAMKVNFPEKITPSMITNPKKASHYRLTIAGASIDFRTGDHLLVLQAGAHLLLNRSSTTAPLQVQLPPASKTPLLLALGISFYREIEGQYHGIGKGRSNAVALVAVSGSQTLKLAS